jgi:flagellar hook protein FlgE
MTPGNAQIPATNAAGAEFAGISVAENGQVVATYADGGQYYVGTVALASFIAPTGLKQLGSSNWEATGLSGPSTFGIPNQGAYGSLMSGALERSNVDIAEELVGPDHRAAQFPGQRQGDRHRRRRSLRRS